MKLTPNPAPFRLSLGDRGEMAACEFLRKKGYEILGKNYKCKLGEIDIIARHKDFLVFIEVRSKTGALSLLIVKSILAISGTAVTSPWPEKEMVAGVALSPNILSFLISENIL